jgi:hypothetical protein
VVAMESVSRSWVLLSIAKFGTPSKHASSFGDWFVPFANFSVPHKPIPLDRFMFSVASIAYKAHTNKAFIPSKMHSKSTSDDAIE